MAINKSDKWDARDLSHRYVVSFFQAQYGDSTKKVTRSPNITNAAMSYFNVAAPDNATNAKICAGLLVSYMEAGGIPYEPEFDESGKDPRTLCFNKLSQHLKDEDGKVLFTADIVDHYFRFINED